MNYSNEIKQLIERQQVGFSLEQDFYVDQEIYQIDLDNVLSRQWHFVDHVSRIPNPGDYLTVEFGNESVIITRDKDSELHAHFNVCRHRGSRICLHEKGNVKRLVCPYHSWVYSLDGKLKVAKQMNQDFDKADYGLHACRLEVFEGLIFINLNPEDASDFTQLADGIRSFVTPHGVTDAKIARTQKYTIEANWKLVVENFRECYHCTTAHPEYTSVNAYVRAGDEKLGSYKAVVDKWAAENPDSPFELGFKNHPYNLQPNYAWRMPIRDGFKTATKDGSPAAPLMGEFKEYDNAETGVFFSPLSYLYFNNDYAVTLRITPINVGQTEVTVNWLVHKDAVEGQDYDPAHVSWMWDVTTIQDGEITMNNQLGINSSHYTPGPYSEREYGAADFTAWYLARLQGKQDERVRYR